MTPVYTKCTLMSADDPYDCACIAPMLPHAESMQKMFIWNSSVYKEDEKCFGVIRSMPVRDQRR